MIAGFEQRPSLSESGDAVVATIDRRRLSALCACQFSSGSRDKRMVRILSSRIVDQDDTRLTEFQGRELERLAWKYRRQLPAALVPETRPDGARA